MSMPDEPAAGDGIILMGDPRVTGIPVSDNGEELTDVRSHGLRVSAFRADGSGDFALVRAGLAARLLQAAEVLPRGTCLLLVEGYRPPALQRRYFDDYRSSLREANPGSDEEYLRVLASRYVSPPEIAPHSAGAAIDLTLCSGDGTELDLGTPVNASPEESAGACYTGHPSVTGTPGATAPSSARPSALPGSSTTRPSGGTGATATGTGRWHPALRARSMPPLPVGKDEQAAPDARQAGGPDGRLTCSRAL